MIRGWKTLSVSRSGTDFLAFDSRGVLLSFLWSIVVALSSNTIGVEVFNM